MLPPLVVFDPACALPLSFVTGPSIPCLVLRVDRADQARRLARHAAVVVVVANEDAATMLGFLASAALPRRAQLVVFAKSVERHRHMILPALRRGAIVLIQQPPEVLVECVADVIASMLPPREVA